MRLFEKWCELCDLVMGYRVDALEAFGMALVLLPAVSAMLYFLVHLWWSKKSHRVAVGLLVLMVLHIPVMVVFSMIVLVRDREPLLRGTRRMLRRFRQSAIPLVKGDAPAIRHYRGKGNGNGRK